MLSDDVVDHGLHKSLLEVEWCLDADKTKTQKTVAQSFGQPGSKAVYDGVELTIGNQFFESLLHFAFLVGANLIKFSHLKLIFNNVGQDVLHLKTCSSYLLGNETGGGHAWSGVDLKHGDVAFRRNDIVDADDAITVQDVVDG